MLTIDDVKSFLTHLAVKRKVAASTQNQAFNALLFLFKHILDKDFRGFDGVVMAKQRRYIPVVLSREEIDRVLEQLPYPNADKPQPKKIKAHPDASGLRR